MTSLDEIPTILTDRDTSRNVTKDVSFTKNKNSIINIGALTRKYFRVKNLSAREFIAEAFGMFLLLAFGLASCAQNLLLTKKDPSANSFLSVNLAFGFGATIAGLVCGKISGAHINPAVSLAMLLTGRMNFRKFIVYLLGQFVGGFFGALMVYVTYIDGIYSYDAGNLTLKTAGIFATYPSAELSIFGALFDQFFATGLLIIVILALTDPKNSEIPHGTVTILIGLTITIIGCSFGYNCGYAINPLRDLAPRIFTLIAGWGSQTFTAGRYFFWIPIVGPMLGSVFGVLVYTLLISNNWP